MISDIIENLWKNYQVEEIGDDDLSGKNFLISDYSLFAIIQSTLCLICLRSFAFLWCKMPMFQREECHSH